MRNLRSKFILSAMICLFAFVTVSAQDAKSSKEVKGKYQNIEVADFDVKEGINFPMTWIDAIKSDIVYQLKEQKLFKQVSVKSSSKTETSETKTETSEAKTETNEATILLVGTVTKYKPGSRAVRYLIGFGAGTTKAAAHVKFIDAATGDVLFEKDVDGKVIIGLMGGDSTGATRGLAKEVAKVAKKKFF
jgi:hypothetical protein